MKLRTKFFLNLVLVSVIPLFIITIFAYIRHQTISEQRMDDICTTLFENAVKRADSVLDSIVQTAGLFTFYGDGRQSVIENLKDFANAEGGFHPYDEFRANQNIKFLCENAFYTNEYLQSIYVFTPSGAVLGMSSGRNGDLKKDYHVEEQEWYKKTLELNGAFYVSSVTAHPMFTGKKPSFFFAQCLRDVYTHRFLGILVLQCAPDLMDLSVINTLPGVVMLAVDNPDNFSVLYSNIDALPGDFPKAQRQILRGDLSLKPLRITAVFDYETLYREYSITGILLLLIGSICATGILLVSLLVSRSMVHPIEHLSRKMASQKGNRLELTSRYLNRTDEVGTLYNEYNSMVEEINASVKHDYQDKLIALDAQMKSLEARINSHFLFNTLESINSMAELAENREIAAMSLSLGNMFRYSIKTDSELVTLEDELCHVRDYVGIQEVRFSHRFHLREEVPENLLALPILKLVLQPLVENALFHGLAYCTEGDEIAIEARKEEGALLVTVRDNGKGMDKETLLALRENLAKPPSFTELGRRRRQSIGLKNIQSRVELYYGHGYGLFVESASGEGTSILLRIPCREVDSLP